MTHSMDGDECYHNFYQPSDIYWGLGIENETYFQLKDDITISQKELFEQRRERYSVDYNLNFKKLELSEQINKQFPNDTNFKIPRYMNCHSLTKCDINLQHKFIYANRSITNTENPDFNGKTIHEMMMEYDPFFKHDYEKKYVFDGDTVEFMTKNFYKTNPSSVIEELVSYKKKFIEQLNNFFHAYLQKEHSLEDNNPLKTVILDYPKYNYGLVSFLSNNNKITPFNNGTYHINITLPTQLDDKGKILDFDKFVKEHRNFSRLLQLIEPLIIGYYGSPDIYSVLGNDKYSLGSLRCTASRYIGVGTYDTDKMIPGKLLNDEIHKTKLSKKDNNWYQKLYENTNYIPCEKIGYDINFNKHYNHGIEIRYHDYIPEEHLLDLINLYILIADHSLVIDNIETIDNNDSWHSTLYECLKYGYNARIPEEYLISLETQLKIKLEKNNNMQLDKLLKQLVNLLYDLYVDEGICCKLMSPNMKKPELFNCNLYIEERIQTMK